LRLMPIIGTAKAVRLRGNSPAFRLLNQFARQIGSACRTSRKRRECGVPNFANADMLLPAPPLCPVSSRNFHFPWPTCVPGFERDGPGNISAVNLPDTPCQALIPFAIVTSWSATVCAPQLAEASRIRLRFLARFSPPERRNHVPSEPENLVKHALLRPGFGNR